MSREAHYKLGRLNWSGIFFFLLLLRSEVLRLYDLKPALTRDSDYQLTTQLKLMCTVTATAAATTNSFQQHRYYCLYNHVQQELQLYQLATATIANIYLQRLVCLSDFK